MDHERYARFFPAEIRARLTVEPESTWWDWRDMRVHVARARRSDADFRALALHGGGGHSELVWPLAALVAQEGVDVAAVDLPLYGRTEVPDRSSVTYPDWIDLLCDFVDAEDDGRPFIVFGASMGGMIAYETAARTGKADKVIATCLLDPTDPEARAAASRFSWTGKLAPKLLRAAAAVAGGISVPISLVADVRAMSRNPALSALCLSDLRALPHRTTGSRPTRERPASQHHTVTIDDAVLVRAGGGAMVVGGTIVRRGRSSRQPHPLRRHFTDTFTRIVCSPGSITAGAASSCSLLNGVCCPVTFSSMLTTPPSWSPASAAYCSALPLASANARSRASETSFESSSIANETPFSRV